MLTVAMADPNNLQALDDLRNLLGITQVIARSSPRAKQIDDAARQGVLERARKSRSLDVIAQLESRRRASGERDRPRDLASTSTTSRRWPNAAPVRKLLNMVLLLAIKDHASDIHFEPFEDEFKIRIKADGVLYEMVPPPRHLAFAITTPHQGHGEPRHRRAAAAAGRPHRADRRRPPGRPARQRAADDVRRERRHAGARPLGRVARPGQGRHGRRTCWPSFREVIDKPNGIVLVTGPTGSGKTTTLYSALNELNDIDDKLITTEDPVEYDIDGIIQVPINPEIGMTFAAVPAGHPAAGPRQDPGRRDPRPGDGRDRRAGVADRPPGVQHAAHQRRPEHDHPAARHGRRSRS